MFQNTLSLPSKKSAGAFFALVAVPVLLMLSIAALNGGTAPTAGIWDAIVTTIQGLLKSNLVIGLALVALMGGVWSIAHGGGYGFLSVVLGVMALAFIGPSVITTIATATPTAQQMTYLHSHSAPAHQSSVFSH